MAAVGPIPDRLTGPERIEDPADGRLADYRSLVDPAARRRIEADGDVMVVEGRVAVRQLVRTQHSVCSLLVDDRQRVSSGDLVEAVLGRGAPVYVASPDVVAATVGFALHRGVVAVARRPTELQASDLLTEATHGRGHLSAPPVIAVLEGLNDHENIGALFRNAAAFGVAGVLLDPTCADPFYRRSIRVSAGHVLRVPFARLAPWPDALEQVRAGGFLMAGLAPRTEGSGRTSITLAELAAAQDARGVALVVGAEGPGLTASALRAVDEVVSIPMAAGVDSLNVATAAAIAFHQLAVD